MLLSRWPSHLQDPSCCAGCLPDRVPKPSGDRASREARRRGCSGKRSFGGAKVTHAALASATARRGPVLRAARLPPPPPRGGTTGPTDHAISGAPSPASGTPQGSSGPHAQPQGEDPSPRKATRRSGKGEAVCRVREQAGCAPESAPPGGGERRRGPGLQVAQSRAVTARGAVGASLAGRQACGGVPCPPGDRRRPPGCGASGTQVAPVPCPLRAPHGPPGVGWGAAVRSCPLSPAGLQGVAQTTLLYSPGGCAACTLRSRGGDPSKPSQGAAKSRPARGPLPGQRPWAPWRAAPHSSRIPSSPA